jgi:hypothetical protein
MTELYVKALELSISAIPGAKRIAVLWNPDTPSHATRRRLRFCGHSRRYRLWVVFLSVTCLLFGEVPSEMPNSTFDRTAGSHALARGRPT